MLGEPIPTTLSISRRTSWARGSPGWGRWLCCSGPGSASATRWIGGEIGPGHAWRRGSPSGYVLLLLLGETTKRRGWAGYAQAVTGGGALLSIPVWASFALYGMVSDPVAFALLVGVTTLAAGLALRHDSVALAVLATLGGFLNPIVWGGAVDAAGVYTYTVALDLGASHWPPFGVGNSWTRSRSTVVDALWARTGLRR